MTEPTIPYPNCKTEIRLTESLAAPLIAATHQQFERQLAQKDEDIAKREQDLRDKEKLIAEARRTLDEQVVDQVTAQLKPNGSASSPRNRREPGWPPRPNSKARRANSNSPSKSAWRTA